LAFASPLRELHNAQPADHGYRDPEYDPRPELKGEAAHGGIVAGLSVVKIDVKMGKLRPRLDAWLGILRRRAKSVR